jgi:SWIM zinc finger
MLTSESVLALAPDDASAKAARGLVAPAKWPLLGADERAVWGECQGSGSKPYQTQVDLSGPAFRCSCPSRKFPCKHGLALLLLRVQDASRFQGAAAPAWVTEWLASRGEKAQKKEERQAERAAAPADPQAAAKREAARWQRIEGAALDLQRWLADQLARGLGALEDAAVLTWHTQAARLVDAQAPGLAQRLRDAATGVRQGSDWPERTLHRLGLLQLACDALARRGELDAARQADLRTLVGWPHDKAEVQTQAEPVEDRWTVLGAVHDERDAKLVERRVWLHGQRTGLRAWLLDHAFGGRGFEGAWLPGTSVRARLHFHPGTVTLRALCAESTVDGDPAWPEPDLAAEWDALARRVATNPWVTLHPLVLRDAIPVASPQGWAVRAGHRNLPLALGEGDAWLLLAASGGHRLHLAGEWNGRHFAALTAWHAEGGAPAWIRSMA